ncbi:MAG: hypothetical protein M0R77_19225 [Gammaproteobacteria bacterium]|nr:hypothetical protein [Gammaproteobacteria bacterium]
MTDNTIKLLKSKYPKTMNKKEIGKEFGFTPRQIAAMFSGNKKINTNEVIMKVGAIL